MIKYSIIIPTYNRADLLNRCLDSLLNQCYKNFEVLVCDDGSIDNTFDVVSKYQKSLDIKYFKLSNWGGPARPRNIGINNAKGDWLCFLDSDDIWTNNKLSIIDKYLNSDVDLLYHKMGLYFNNYNFSNKILYTRPLKNNPFKDLLLNGNVICNSSVVVRKSIIKIIGGINEEIEMIGCEDYNTWLKVSLITNQIVFVPRLLGYYDLHLNGLSRKDMSLMHSSAVKDFLYLCSDKEKKYIEAHIKYMRCRYNYSFNKIYKIDKELLFCIRYGKFNIKLKSIYLFFIKKLKNV